MLRQTAFAVASLFVCSLASAQQPYSPYLNYGGASRNPGLNCANGFCGPANCPNGNCATSPTICGPNGCYKPNVAPYRSRAPFPTMNWPYGNWNSGYRSRSTFPVPSSSYHGFPNSPSGYPNRGPVNYYPPISGQLDPYDTYAGPGNLH